MNSSSTYEVISVYKLDSELGPKIEVSLRGKKTWELQFQNIYKAFQFLQ